jgi:hypothetical protein
MSAKIFLKNYSFCSFLEPICIQKDCPFLIFNLKLGFFDNVKKQFWLVINSRANKLADNNFNI